MEEIKGNFERIVGIEVVCREKEKTLLKLPFREDLLNPRGFMHGGVICSLADTALAVCASVVFPQRKFSTLKLTVEFKRPVRTESLFASARILRKRDKSFYGTVEIYDEHGNLVAGAEGIFFLS
ncbi:MAG: PaaI family thioesterase [Candidatus Omnitrophica bacterium]|nr:PaaI family thioesterase [Candidatus Omnitrophota bacterium]